MSKPAVFSSTSRWKSTKAQISAFVIALGWTLTVHAQTDSPWSFSGFGTAGVLRNFSNKPWGFVRNSNQVGAGPRWSVTQDSRLGAQVNWNGGPQWEAALQGVVVNTPSGTPASEAIQWAYAGYRPTPDSRIRLGRTSPDIFLFSDSRSVGFALPWVRPPADFYEFFPLASIDGIDGEQRWDVGDAVWRVRGSAGVVGSSVTDQQGSRIPLHGKNTLALGLSREEGGLLLKLSYLRSQVHVDTGGQVGQLQDGLDAIASLPVPGLASQIQQLNPDLWTGGPVSYLALAAQYERGPWTFISEVSQLWVPNSPLNARRGYVSAGWRDGTVTYYGLASRVLPTRAASTQPDLTASLTPVIGAAQAEQAQALVGYAVSAGDNYRFDQATFSAGLRWDFAPTAALKVQLDHYKVYPNGGAGWRFYDNSAGQGNLVSVVIDFVVGQ